MSLLIPPINFGMVDDDIYRSGEPIELNFPFLESLQLRTLLVLSSSPPSPALQAFVNDQNFSADGTDADGDFHSDHAFSPFVSSPSCRPRSCASSARPSLPPLCACCTCRPPPPPSRTRLLLLLLQSPLPTRPLRPQPPLPQRLERPQRLSRCRRRR